MHTIQGRGDGANRDAAASENSVAREDSVRESETRVNEKPHTTSFLARERERTSRLQWTIAENQFTFFLDFKINLILSHEISYNQKNYLRLNGPQRNIIDLTKV